MSLATISYCISQEGIAIAIEEEMQGGKQRKFLTCFFLRFRSESAICRALCSRSTLAPFSAIAASLSTRQRFSISIDVIPGISSELSISGCCGKQLRDIKFQERTGNLTRRINASRLRLMNFFPELNALSSRCFRFRHVCFVAMGLQFTTSCSSFKAYNGQGRSQKRSRN